MMLAALHAFDAAAWNARTHAEEFLNGERSESELLALLAENAAAWRDRVNAHVAVGEEISEVEALAAGRTQSTLAYALIQRAFTIDASTAETGGSSTESSYLLLLDQLHSVALGEGDFAAAHDEAVALVVGPAAALARSVGAMTRRERSRLQVGIRTSELLRRICATPSWVCMLDRRTTGARLRSGLRTVAENRAELRRVRTEHFSGSRALIGLSEGDRLAVTGTVTDIGWVGRPETPYSAITLDHGRFELRVHHRYAPGVGVAVGRNIWARGKYEQAQDEPIVVAEFEGLTAHASHYWEDWLAVEARDAFDIAPKSLELAWEIPDPRYRCGMNDLWSRIFAVIGA